MDGTHNVYIHCIDKTPFSFLNTCSEFNKPTYKMGKIWVRDLNISVDFALELEFILFNKGATIITSDRNFFLKSITHTSALTSKPNTKIRHKLKEKCCDKCENNSTCSKIGCNIISENLSEIEELEDLDELDKNYVLIETTTKLY